MFLYENDYNFNPYKLSYKWALYTYFVLSYKPKKKKKKESNFFRKFVAWFQKPFLSLVYSEPRCTSEAWNSIDFCKIFF